jgi:hypothetical protein
VTDTTGSLRPLVAAAATDAALDPRTARADDRFDALRHAVAAISRDLGVHVEFWGPGDGTDGWAADEDGDTDAVAMLRAPGHPANGLVVRGHTVADTHERVLALLMALRATGAFFAPHPSRLN